MDLTPIRVALAIVGVGILAFLGFLLFAQGCSSAPELPPEPEWVETVHDAGANAAQPAEVVETR